LLLRLGALLLHLGALLLHLLDFLAQIQNGTTGFVIFKKRGLGRAYTKTKRSRKDSSQGKNGHGLQSFSPGFSGSSLQRGGYGHKPLQCCQFGLVFLRPG